MTLIFGMLTPGSVIGHHRIHQAAGLSLSSDLFEMWFLGSGKIIASFEGVERDEGEETTFIISPVYQMPCSPYPGLIKITQAV